VTNAGIETGFPLARLTTIGTGGPARALARPRTIDELGSALSFAASEGLEVVVVGLGSHRHAGEGGAHALVGRLDGDLAAVTVHGERLVAGGGATNAVCLHRARAAGLGGFEFACAIPGTAGGGVRMNAGAYGSDWATILERALVVSVDGSGWLGPEELGLSYRHSGLVAGEVVAKVEYRLSRSSPTQIRATVSDLVQRRKTTQPTNKRTFGSVFNNPP
jgi:UDP-N-acetylmuramate dehydrogenase